MSGLTQDQKTEALSLLADLIRIDSANPSREESNRRRSEEQIIGYLQSVCESVGMEVRLHEVYPGRANLIGHWPDQAGRHTLAFQAHADTVGTGTMTIEPFGAEIRAGRIWGRGACDDKGSLAAFLTALKIMRHRGQKLADKPYLIVTVGEETGCEGAAALMASGFRVDACVAGEPTRCRLVTAHKGSLWFKLIAHGIPSHTAVPEKGRNAIYAMSRAIRFVEEDFAGHVSDRPHPLLGLATMTVSVISGGTAVNIVPARCEASIDCRYLPNQSYVEIAQRLERELKVALPQDADALEVGELDGFPAMESDPHSPFVQNLLAGCRAQTGQSEPEGVYYFADSGMFSHAGIPCVLFGPGDIADAHKAEESLELDQYFLSIETVLTWLGRHSERSILE